MARLVPGRAAGASGQVGPFHASAVQPVLVLTEDLGRVSMVLGPASRRQRQAISVFVGGSPRHRSNTAGFGELFFADEVRHRQTDFVSQFETFLLLGVSSPTIARLAQLVISEPLEIIAFDALSRTKTVLMDPIANDPLFGGMPSAMKEEFSRFSRRLASFGVRQEPVGNLFAVAALSTSAGDGVDRSDFHQQGSSPSQGPAERRRSGSVILTVRDIQDTVGPSSQLTVTGPYRLTDLAREYVDKNGITIQAP